MKKLIFISIALSLLITPAVFAQSFEDVPPNHWAYSAVEKLFQQGIISGFPDKTFKGNKEVSRYELAAVMYKILEKILIIEANVKQQTKEIKESLESVKNDLNNRSEEVTKDRQNLLEEFKKQNNDIKETILKAISPPATNSEEF